MYSKLKFHMKKTNRQHDPIQYKFDPHHEFGNLFPVFSLEHMLGHQ